MYHANMCGLCTVDYEVSPLSHILCKYGFNDILSIPPLPTRHSRRYRNSHLLSLVNITQPSWQPPSSHLVLMFSKDQSSLSQLETLEIYGANSVLQLLSSAIHCSQTQIFTLKIAAVKLGELYNKFRLDISVLVSGLNNS